MTAMAEALAKIERAPYVSPYLRRIFITQKAAAMARRYDDKVVYWLERGMDLPSARDMADASVRYDWSPEEQRDYQIDADRAQENRDWKCDND